MLQKRKRHLRQAESNACSVRPTTMPRTVRSHEWNLEGNQSDDGVDTNEVSCLLPPYSKSRNNKFSTVVGECR